MKTVRLVLGITMVILAMAAIVRHQVSAAATKNLIESKTTSASASGVENPNAFPHKAGFVDFTLQRARDFHYVGGNIDCPNCKDLFTARIAPPVPGAIITSVTVTARRPASNNHWFRCQVEARCGRAEFSDPNDARLDCLNKPACYVNRATDDGVGGYEDDIHMTYK